ncbi:MAG: hypothetical protein AAGB22_03115 [Bacteroidota bacterium]
MIRTWFKISQPKGFDYQPRYYDRDKEELQKRVSRIEREMQAEQATEATQPEHLRQEISGQWRRSHRKSQHRQSNVMVLIITAALLVGVYLVYQRLVGA